VAKGRPKRVLQYSNKFKLQAVRLSELEGVKVNDVAEALDIHPFMLSRWRKEVREGKIKGRSSIPPEAKAVKKKHEEMDAFARLKRSYALLQEEHDLLKKLHRFSSELKAQSSNS
jgi:transposase